MPIMSNAYKKEIIFFDIFNPQSPIPNIKNKKLQ